MSNKYHKCKTDNMTSFGDWPRPKKSKPSEDSVASSPSKWNLLPSIVVHEIFDLLDKQDRQNASSVCKNWRQNVFHPKWWPSITFEISPDNLEKANFLTTKFCNIVTNATIKFNTLSPQCTDEFVVLIEGLSENNNLRELIIEPTHCHFDMSLYNRGRSYDVSNVIERLKLCLPKLTKFSIGCIEDFSTFTDEYLDILIENRPAKVTHLGLATVKDNPIEYESSHFDPARIQPFTGLQILSIDYEELSDRFLDCLKDAKDLERLVVHLHGLRNGTSGTTEAAWEKFVEIHPKCQLRLTVIHAYKEIDDLHKKVLKEKMPLTHLKVFFCENVNIPLLEDLPRMYANTLRSLVWVDSLSGTKNSRVFSRSLYETTPDPLVMIAWLCQKLEELVFYGYKYKYDNLIAIARLRGNKLKRLEVAEEDVVFSLTEHNSRKNFLLDIPQQLKRPWAPVKSSGLHPVIRGPTLGDSDEYLLPLVLSDLRHQNH